MEDNNGWRFIHSDYTQVLDELPKESDYIEVINIHTGISQFGFFNNDGRHFFVRLNSEDSNHIKFDNHNKWRFATKQ